MESNSAEAPVFSDEHVKAMEAIFQQMLDRCLREREDATPRESSNSGASAPGEPGRGPGKCGAG